jgi:hypothetical protein
MSTSVHRPLKVIKFHANGIGRQHYELSKHLQDLRIDVALFSDTWGLMRDPFFKITTFIEPTATEAEKAELLLQLGEASPITM